MGQEFKRRIAALCTFALGLTAVMFWIEYRRPAIQHLETPPCFRPPYYESTPVPCFDIDLSALGDIPHLRYCELVNDVDRYDNKVVSVNARLVSFIHGTALYDPQCPSTYDRRTESAIFFQPAMAEENKQSLAQASGSAHYYGFEPLDLVVVGRLKKVIPSHMSDAIWDTASLRFEIIRVEKASKNMQEKLR